MMLLGAVGCAGNFETTATTGGQAAAVLQGSVHGGQQPVSGATIQLYAVGTTADQSAATPLLTQPVLSDIDGNFTITGLYSCTGATQVYITATGGIPGGSLPNPNLAMMTALGACSSLTPATQISIDENTTVAATSALASYMSSYTAVGSGTSDAAALTQAFALAAEYVSTSNGQAPGQGIPAGYSDPVSLINTLGDIVSACINSTGGVAGDGTNCGNLFTLTTPSGGHGADRYRDSVAQYRTHPAGEYHRVVQSFAGWWPVPAVAQRGSCKLPVGDAAQHGDPQLLCFPGDR